MSPRTAEQAAAYARDRYDNMRREVHPDQPAHNAAVISEFETAALNAVVLELWQLRGEQHRTNELLTQLIGALAARHGDFRDDETGAPLPVGVEGYGVPR